MVLVFKRQIYKASILKRSVGEADIQRPCQICFSPKQGETKELSSIPPRHKEHVFTLQIQASELSSLSQELVTNSTQFKKKKKYLHSHSKSEGLSLYLGSTNISFSAKQLYIMNFHAYHLILSFHQLCRVSI